MGVHILFYHYEAVVFSMHQNQREEFLGPRSLDSPPGFLVQEVWGWGLRICMSSKFPGDSFFL